MNKIANRQIICEVLMKEAKKDKEIFVLCSDSRGSGSMTVFAEQFPDQFVEVGIAEQNLVSISAGLASCAKKPFAVAPACFLSTRSMEQIKVDVAYSNTNVKLIGISGGVSYGALGMTHHSTTDIAALASIPGMRVYFPSDRFQTSQLILALLEDRKPAYIRVGRNPVPDIYKETHIPFEMNRSVTVREGKDITVIACGEMVKAAVDASDLLKEEGIYLRVIDMYCIKPLDETAILKAATETKGLITIEEHVRIGGMGSMISQLIAEKGETKVVNLSLPDTPVIAGKSQEIFSYYGLDKDGIIKTTKELLKK